MTTRLLWRALGTTSLIASTLVACGKNSSSAKAVAIQDSGAVLLAKGDSVAAVDVFSRAIALDSTLVNAYRGRAIARKNLGQYELAITDYNKAVLLDPTSASTFNNRGFTHQLMGEFQISVADFDAAIALSPDFTPAYRNRARSQFYLGRFVQAATDFRAGPYVEPTNSYEPIWTYMATERAGLSDTAEMSVQVVHLDLSVWPGAVAKYFLGRIKKQALVDAAVSSDPAVQRVQQCGLAFYLGQQLLWQKPVNGPDAKVQLGEAVALCPKSSGEYLAAKADLERLQK